MCVQILTLNETQNVILNETLNETCEGTSTEIQSLSYMWFVNLKQVLEKCQVEAKRHFEDHCNYELLHRSAVLITRFQQTVASLNKTPIMQVKALPFLQEQHSQHQFLALIHRLIMMLVGLILLQKQIPVCQKNWLSGAPLQFQSTCGTQTPNMIESEV